MPLCAILVSGNVQQRLNSDMLLTMFACTDSTKKLAGFVSLFQILMQKCSQSLDLSAMLPSAMLNVQCKAQYIGYDAFLHHIHNTADIFSCSRNKWDKYVYLTIFDYIVTIWHHKPSGVILIQRNIKLHIKRSSSFACT